MPVDGEDTAESMDGEEGGSNDGAASTPLLLDGANLVLTGRRPASPLVPAGPSCISSSPNPRDLNCSPEFPASVKSNGVGFSAVDDTLDRRRCWQKRMPRTMMLNPTTPPITPPTMAPTDDLAL